MLHLLSFLGLNEEPSLTAALHACLLSFVFLATDLRAFIVNKLHVVPALRAIIYALEFGICDYNSTANLAYFHPAILTQKNVHVCINVQTQLNCKLSILPFRHLDPEECMYQCVNSTQLKT